ncbi:MAG: ABC transporter permease [Bacteroidetes bacterium]|nr:ABC transporter permease [Bacteroidota bacterium]
MFDIDKWKEIWATITRNKTRSLLTAFGVSWGLFMFILLVGFGNGFKKGIMDNFEGFAVNSCFFFTDRTGEAYKGHRKGRNWDMNSKDLRLIREKASSVEYLAPMLFADGKSVRGNKTGSYTSLGVYPDYFAMQQMIVLNGRIINEIDVSLRRKVCVIGQEVYETLFNVGEDPLGQSIRTGGIYYQVVGVVKPKSTNATIGSNPVKTVFIPFSTQQQTSNRGDEIDFLGCTAKPGCLALMVEEEVKTIIKANHEISPTDQKALVSINLEEEFHKINNLFSGITVLIWIVGLGALLSGIIGISNIMLVTVRERMREIGVRRAIGAKPLSIITQIMSESFVLTTLAGLAGFMAGVGILMLLQQFMAGGQSGNGLVIIPFVSFNLALVAMAILVFSSLLAGLMPAIRALNIKAIDAIRDE